MKARRPLVIVLAAVGLAGVAVAVVLAVALWPTSAASAPYRGSQVPGDVRLPSFVLREWNGARVNSARLKGKVVLVTFLETMCKEACPLIARQVGDGLRLLNRNDRQAVYALAVSTHPFDDTPKNVRTFLRHHRVLNDLHYLIGTPKQLRPVWDAFHVLAALDSGDANTHSAPVRIFNREGRWVTTLHPGVDLTVANLAHDVRTALRSH